MTDCKNLELAREWAEWMHDNPDVYGGTSDRARAAADLISSLPDEWVDAEKLREVVADHHIDMSEELMEALGALLSTPPAPEPATPRPEDVPVGEAWLIDIDGERTVALLGKVDPADDEPTWFTDDGCGYSFDSGNPVARLVPETTEQDDEPMFSPNYIYTDRDGDEWEYIDGRWITGDTHAERVAVGKARPGFASLLAEYGPYTRIEDTK